MLTELPYAHAALEPHIDAHTLKIHHTAHHASYVQKLNDTLAAHEDLRERSAFWLVLNLDRVPGDIRTAVRNNAGGHVNHCLFWHAMAPGNSKCPGGALAAAIERDFGGFDAFKSAFVDAGKKVFGSGWVWLVGDQDGKLQVATTQGHDNPAAEGLFPVLVNDVWEHAYYLKHQNQRASYLEGWWPVVDWDEAARRYGRLQKAVGVLSYIPKEQGRIAW